jgi:hypothetical protein
MLPFPARFGTGKEDLCLLPDRRIAIEVIRRFLGFY